ncbi:ABC transporter permease [Micromonospora endophytica]|uniref:ABC transporter permease n=1 Tax=Micromonospora endophytica TaxID=515350 RepID=A0A2W2C1A7_9ACTN|nr:FtsX-like permease family protein [Micromonospora endophytica]PZF93395.1 ABC transporter permease [Micromonospora endophytica]RIW48321.1 FtsX-like permease family protein [Micromonospora endophytica]BCJ56677.1 ABC transporter substrate-binding protein [Micromonospora endophytica]
MFRLTLRALRAEALRMLMSTVSVVLGVAFIAGTLIFVDGMRAGTYDRAATFDRHTDVDVHTDGEPSTASLVDRVRTVDGVRAAEGELTGTAGVVGSDGRPVLGFGFLAAVPADPALQSYDLVAGRLPTRPGEVVLDHRTVADEGFALGTPVRVGGSSGAARPYTLVGTVDVANTARDLGGPFIGLVGPDALAVADSAGFDRIMVAAEPGVSDRVLAERIAAVVGTEPTVRTRQVILDEAVTDAVRDLDQFRTLLLTFVGVAVVVAAFVIVNTFTIVLAQRSRQTALLRLVGATRGQVFRATLLESGLLGLVASGLGVVVGAGLAVGMTAVLSRLSLPLHGEVTVTAGTVLGCLVAGTVLTVGAALVPAWHGTRVAPVAALTDAAIQVTRPAGRARLACGAVVLAAGVAALAGAAAAGQILLVALGGSLSFLGIVLFGPVLVPALIRVFGAPVRRIFGATSALAVANAVRNPRRVAATATALVIGIGLVASFVVGAGSTKAAIERGVDAQVGVDFVVTGIGVDLPVGVVDALAARPELGLVHEARTHTVDDVVFRAADPALVDRRLDGVLAGQVDRLGPGRVLVHRELATRRGWSAGDRITLRGAQFEVAAVVTGAGGEVYSAPTGHLVDLVAADFTRLFPDVRGYLAEVDPAAGVSAASARAAIAEVLADYPTVNLMDQAAYKRMLTGTVDMLLTFVLALLGLAVVIALVGVANTLSLSVVERTRENAVLRAVGLTGGRMRAMLATEAVLTALVGAVLGVALGTGVAAGAMAMLGRISGQFTLVVPWAQLGGILAVAVLAALAASVLPARRALAVPVVEALADQ